MTDQKKLDFLLQKCLEHFENRTNGPVPITIYNVRDFFIAKNLDVVNEQYIAPETDLSNSLVSEAEADEMLKELLNADLLKQINVNPDGYVITRQGINKIRT